jgi:hypothetical protein
VPFKLTPQSSATHASLAQDIVPIRCYSQKEDVTQSGTFCFSCGRKIQDSGTDVGEGWQIKWGSDDDVWCMPRGHGDEVR